MKRHQVYVLIDAERKRQKERWVDDACHSRPFWLLLLTEELGELAAAVLDQCDGDYVFELTQLAAVAIAALEQVETNDETQ